VVQVVGGTGRGSRSAVGFFSGVIVILISRPLQASRGLQHTFLNIMYAALAVTPVVGQAPIVEWTRVVSTPTEVPLVEAEIAVSFTDPRVLLAVGMTTDAESSYVYASQNGGLTWSLGRRFPGGDPAFASDPDGGFLFSTITPQLHVWSTRDGEAWDAWAPSERRLDRQWLGLDPTQTHDPVAAAKTSDPRGGRSDVPILFRWDRGRSTATPSYPPPPEAGFLQTVTDLVFGWDGTLFMPYFVNFRASGERPAELVGEQRILTSIDGGETWDGPVTLGTRRSFGNAKWDLGMKGLGGGRLAVSPATDELGSTVYVVWSSAVNGFYRVELVRSKDGGRTWSQPVRVDSGSDRSNHGTPAVAVTGDGTVVATWYDRSDDPADLCYRPFVGMSRDEGRSFSRTAISVSQTCMPSGSRWLNGGDTQGIGVTSDDAVVVAWIGREDGGRTRLMVSKVRLP
jgi:hypothetical protein